MYLNGTAKWTNEWKTATNLSDDIWPAENNREKRVTHEHTENELLTLVRHKIK